MTSQISELLFARRFMTNVKKAALVAIDKAKFFKTDLVIYRDDKVLYKTAGQASRELNSKKK